MATPSASSGSGAATPSPAALPPQPGAPSAEPGDATDAALLRRMADGDEGALAVLYDRWVDPVHALVLHVVRDAAEAEDVVEEVFWQAWRQAARFDPVRGGVSTWLFTIARSRALDRRRALARSREELAGAEETPAAETASPAPGPAEAAEAAERRARVRSALDELPPEQREALELAYFGGMSQVEIAERTGSPLGTVKTRVRLALQKLRGRLAPLREGREGREGAER
ncbi:MAG: RNA polymerase sigma factor [Gemmatimonadaceae bacterium]